MLGDALAHRAHRLERSRPRRPRPVAPEPEAGAARRLRAAGGGGRRAPGLCRRLGGLRPVRACSGLRAGLDEREDVLLRHAAAAAGALHLARVDAVLGRDPRDDRGDEAVPLPDGCARGWCGAGCCGRRRGGSLGLAARRGALGCGAGSRRLGRGCGLGRGEPRPARRPRARSPRAASRPRPSRPPGRGSPGRRRRPGSAPRCRPCRSRSRAAARPAATCSPGLLEPLRDRALGDGDAHLGHDDVDLGSGRHGLSTPPARAALRPRRRPAG